MPPVKGSRTIIPIELKGIRSLVQAFLVLANLIEGMRVRIVEVKGQAGRGRFAQAHEPGVVVRAAVTADDVRVQDLVQIRPGTVVVFPEVGVVKRRESR